MRKLLPATILMTVIILFAVGSIWANDDVNTKYLMAVGDYFDVSYDEVNTIAGGDITLEEVPVVFYMAQLSKKSPKDVLFAVENNTTWPTFMSQHNIHQASVLVDIYKFKTPECKAIMDKIKNRPLSTVEFDEQDIITLVNYRFLANTSKVKLAEIVTKRDGNPGSQKSFVEINNLFINQNALAQNDSNK